jgi:protein-disulfide isomerase
MTPALGTFLLAAQLAVQHQQAVSSPAATERVDIVVFSDFHCPFCAEFAQPIREVQSKGVEGVETSVRFVHFPLSIHPAAQLAHQAALAAKEQGKFWEMHDLLFANHGKVQRADLLGYAKRLGLDLERFERDLDSERVRRLIEIDKAEGNTHGVEGTPTFTINGSVYIGARSLAQLKQLVQREWRRTRALAEVPETLMSKGPGDAPVTVEFFADLQSPVSVPAIDVVTRVMQQYPATVRLQFRNFPLAFHPQAGLAHEAAMAAARQGRFWEFAAFVLDHQDSLRGQDLVAYAGRLGFDQAEFAAILEDHRYAPRVQADVAAGLRRGIRGSPVVFVNGRRIDGVPTLHVLAEYVEAELRAQRPIEKAPLR